MSVAGVDTADVEHRARVAGEGAELPTVGESPLCRRAAHHDDRPYPVGLYVPRLPAGEPVEIEPLLGLRERVERVADQNPVTRERQLLGVDAVGEDRRASSRRGRQVEKM